MYHQNKLLFPLYFKN
uniref:Uncharacterized protein n=1 Tax=Rhizophora mucronata TaxID=61149 RepID=A0A2P2MYH7_RHIMU